MAFDLQSSQLSINIRLLQYQIQKVCTYSHATCQKFIYKKNQQKAKIDSNYRGKTITAGFFTKEDEEVNGLRKKSLPFLVYFVPSFVVKKLLTLKMYMDLCRTQFQLLTVLWLGPFDPLQKKRPIYKIQNCFCQVLKD